MNIVIENPLVLEQLKKVLRMQKGDVIAVQQQVESSKLQAASHKDLMKRYVVRIDDWDHKCVYGTIIETLAQSKTVGPSVTMYIAMPNKRDKAELIAQKLAELGVASIVFWRGERSILREMNDAKVARIHKIMREAVEQSWGWQVPIVSFQLDQDWVLDEEVVMFDIQDQATSYKLQAASSRIIGVVGPEGGLTQRDYEHFPDHVVSSLGNTILRMETAAIVGAYELQIQR